MRYRKLGKSDLNVSVVALGTMSVTANMTYPEIEVSQAVATVHAALDCGINFFDTAPMYGDGEAERRLGLALRGRRDRAIIATKAGGPTLRPEEVVADCEISLQRLGTDVIDLYQIHWHRRVVPIADTIAAMQKLVDAGKVRWIGVCNSGPADLGEALAAGRIVSNQIAYNLLYRAAEFEVAQLCERENVGILCYSPLLQGLLSGRFKHADEVPPERARSRHFRKNRPQARHQEPGCETEVFAAIAGIAEVARSENLSMADLAGAWLLHQPAVASILAGASRPEQVHANARCADVELLADTMARLDAITSEVKRLLGANLDPWQTDSRIR